MPGRSLEESTADDVPTFSLGSLKGHKAFPRRNRVAAGPDYTRSFEQEKKIRHRSDQIIYTSAERIKSWIPGPSSTHFIPVPDRALTPPINFRDDFQSWIDDAALRRRGFGLVDGDQNPRTTSLVEQSLPTPEESPPKKIDRAQAIASFSSSRDLIESRTDSFKTALENQPSDDDNNLVETSSLHPLQHGLLQTTGLSKHKDVGLGLGLESEDEDPTPREVTPRRSPKPRDFDTFDGVWGEKMNERKTTEVLEDPLKPTTYMEKHKRPRLASERVTDSPTLGMELDTPAKKSFSLRERVERTRNNSNGPSSEKVAQRFDRAPKDDVSDSDTEVRDMVSKRLSEVSTNSTVMGAVVFDSPPQRRQTLRRTSKMPDLHTPSKHPNRNSNSSGAPLRRRLRRSGSPDPELRKSFTSADRRSSLHSSNSGSKRLSRTFSVTPPQQSSRPTTAPEESVGYFDIPRPRDRRTMSVVVHAPTPLKLEPRVLRESATMTAETSPPSVPTSTTEQLSKSSSVTSTGMNALHAPATSNAERGATLHLLDTQNGPNSSTDQPGTSEWSAMRPRSTLVTPFSLRSAHSSTPGTLEVNEATAISIYPHTNKSILVIQQMPGRGESSPKECSKVIARNASISLPGAVIPTSRRESPPEPARDILDSPLQNPREPPQPPDLKIIPPTPANASGSFEKGRFPPKSMMKMKRFSAPVSTIKRALSARRPRPASLAAPFSRTFSLRGTAGNPSRRPQTDESQARLHPFWRPRSSYDATDSESEFGNTGFLHGSRVQSHSSSRDGPPRRTMSLTRRLTNTMRLPHPAKKQRPSSMMLPSDFNNYEFRRSGDLEHEVSKAENVPGQGYPVQFVGLRGLANKLERRRVAKEEGKREERRQWLRGKIGPVRRGSMGAAVVQ